MEIEAFVRALGSGTRLKALILLQQRSYCVEELAEVLDESIANVSQHLRKLTQAGLVEMRKEGQRRRYAVAQPESALALDALFSLAVRTQSKLAEFERARAGGDSVPLERVAKALFAGGAQLLDARPPQEVLETGIEKSIPIEGVPSRVWLSQLDPSKEVFVLCRGHFCDLAQAVVKQLKAQGFSVFKVREGPRSLKEALSKLKAPRPMNK
jgi:DNA-binding transcriptional ArsR family regulator